MIARCTACDLTPDRKKGISTQSGRVKIDVAKPQKHLKAIVQLNITAESVKTGVKLACENAFATAKNRGQYCLQTLPDHTDEDLDGDTQVQIVRCINAQHQHLLDIYEDINVVAVAHESQERVEQVKPPNLGATTPEKHKVYISMDDQRIYEWLTPVPIQGKAVSQEGYVRRFDLALLRIFERCWIDVKSLPAGQFQGKGYALVFVCMKSFAIDVMLMNKKDETAECTARYVVRRGIHKLPYTVTFHHDNDGSNLAVAVKLAGYGIRTEPTVPYRQSLNVAELAIRVLMKAAKRACLHARFHHEFLGLAMQHCAHHHNSISGS